MNSFCAGCQKHALRKKPYVLALFAPSLQPAITTPSPAPAGTCSCHTGRRTCRTCISRPPQQPFGKARDAACVHLGNTRQAYCLADTAYSLNLDAQMRSRHLAKPRDQQA